MEEKKKAVRVEGIPKICEKEERRKYMFFIDKEGYVAKVPYASNKLSEEEKQQRIQKKKAEQVARKEARIKENAKKWEGIVTQNKIYKQERDSKIEQIRDLTKEIVQKARIGKDVSGIQEKRNILETRVAELRSLIKVVPKKYKK